MGVSSAGSAGPARFQDAPERTHGRGSYQIRTPFRDLRDQEAEEG